MFLAVDPGRDKTGIALLDNKGLVGMTIVESNALVPQIESFLRKNEADLQGIVCGNGTHHQKISAELKMIAEKYNVVVKIVDEYNTTVEGRQRYWEMTERKGWRKFLPASWFMPPVPVDDYTAWIIGERFLKEKEKESHEKEKSRK